MFSCILVFTYICSKLAEYLIGICVKLFNDCLIQPAAVILQRLRQVPVIECNHWCDVVSSQLRGEILVIFHTRRIVGLVGTRGEYSRPWYWEPVMGNLKIKAITAASDNMCRVIDSSTTYYAVQTSVHYFPRLKLSVWNTHMKLDWYIGLSLRIKERPTSWSAKFLIRKSSQHR